jgi:hypothetical protein
MTQRKDFKRIVRARARRTGESYSSALRNLRNARHNRSAAAGSTGSNEEGSLMAITRAIPDVRSTNIDKTIRFYTSSWASMSVPKRATWWRSSRRPTTA